MINQYDLYDMTFAFLLMRNDIKNSLNNEVLKKIISVLENKTVMYEDNSIRKAISSIQNLNYEQWQFAYYNNVYVNHRFLSNDYIYSLLTTLCKEAINILNQHHYERAFDLIDSFHCLPEMIANNNFLVPRQFWKIYVTSYRIKWDKNFLIEEQKKLK